MDTIKKTERILEENCELIQFIQDSPTAYQAVEQTVLRLEAAGYKRQFENRRFTADDRRGYVIRNGSSLIAYSIPQTGAPRGFHMVCAHTDSPAFKIKENPGQTDANGYQRLNVEKYGGMIGSTWLDRPLSLAGRVVCETAGLLQEKNIHFREPLFVIPNLAIHMTRGEPSGPLSVQQDLQPLAGTAGAPEKRLYEMLAGQLGGVKTEDILGADLFLYNPQPGCLVGPDKKLLCAPRLDDLQCVYAALKGFLAAQPQENGWVRVLGLFDNEEVGSLTQQGAASDFLERSLENIVESLGMTPGDYRRMLADSFMVSADNAHAVHPNHAEKADPTNRPVLNKGIVIKYHGGQKYTTDACTGAYIKQICRNHGILYQTYHNHSDIAGGSTLGNLILGNSSVPAADIGAPQLAMHSACETAGAYDTFYLTEFMKKFYEQ